MDLLANRGLQIESSERDQIEQRPELSPEDHAVGVEEA